jgi:hypothetical protein
MVRRYGSCKRAQANTGKGSSHLNDTEIRRPRGQGQNQNFAASCTTRGSSAVVIVSCVAGTMCWRLSSLRK